jgi:ABC-type lipoprotein export system ATPase subunit
VAIARALINKPDIVLADEPTGALDSRTSAEIMNIFQELNRTQGITIIVVTHSDEVAARADRIIGFRDGLIVSDAPVIHPKSGAAVRAPVLVPVGATS